MRCRFELAIRGCNPIADRTVLDVGCGPGHYSVALARRGAREVLGIDFAPGMIDLAKHRAECNQVPGRCRFVSSDFMAYPFEHLFDYSIVMGLMDYIAEPGRIIDKVLSITRSKAFFSFPAAGGILGWQRQLRYKSRCGLFLYRREGVQRLFDRKDCRYNIEKISRDFFVTADVGHDAE